VEQRLAITCWILNVGMKPLARSGVAGRRKVLAACGAVAWWLWL